MPGSTKSLPTRLIVALLGYCAVACGTSAGPDLEREAASIPWSQITGRIAYSRNTPGAGGHVGSLFIIDGNSKTLTLVKQSEEFLELAWKYDGTEITYRRFGPRWSELHSIGPGGGTESIVYSVDAHNGFPAWSRDGRLAYWFNGSHPSCALGTCSWSVFIDNSPFFTDAMCAQTRPAWSPDSRFLAISMLDSTSQGSLYRVSLSDTAMLPLLQGQGAYNAEIFSDPIYSPDGTRIAFTKWGSGLDQTSEIWIMNADGTNPSRLTSGHYDWYPAWSPDGNKIAFGRGYPDNIFLMDSDGTGVTQVTRSGGQYPTWIP
jgi:Tol biopolymer transport system component